LDFNLVTRNKNMNLSITTRFVAFALAIILAFGLSLTPAFAAHPDEDVTSHTTDAHDDESAHEEATPSIVQMKALIALLTQLVALLQEQAGISHADGESHTDGDGTDGLAVWIEIHSNRTHGHVQETGKEIETFFIDEFDYTEEGEIVDFIAQRTGLSAHEIEEVITFPSGEVDENGDSMDEDGDEKHAHDASDENIEGIHIMANGTVMNGEGEEVHGAVITADGKIMLEDGDIVEPEFDLR
jgi:hypothetical protein